MPAMYLVCGPAAFRRISGNSIVMGDPIYISHSIDSNQIQLTETNSLSYRAAVTHLRFCIPFYQVNFSRL